MVNDIVKAVMVLKDYCDFSESKCNPECYFLNVDSSKTGARFPPGCMFNLCAPSYWKVPESIYKKVELTEGEIVVEQ